MQDDLHANHFNRETLRHKFFFYSELTPKREKARIRGLWLERGLVKLYCASMSVKFSCPCVSLENNVMQHQQNREFSHFS